MRKKKDGPALFELIHRAKAKPSDQLAVPEWITGGRKPIRMPLIPSPAPATPAPPVEQEVEPEPVEVEVVERPAPPAKPVATPSRLARRSERLLATEGKRLKLTITTFQAIAVGVALLAMVVGVFLLGRGARQGSDPGAAPAGKAPAAAPKQGMSDWSLRATAGGGANPAPAARPPHSAEPGGAQPPAAANGPLEKDKYYLVVQGLMGTTDRHRAEAEAIAEFLNGHGERVAVMKYSGVPTQYIVMSLRSFDDPDSAEARRYIRAIEEQGKLYRSQGGRYDFRQGETGWFVKG